MNYYNEFDPKVADWLRNLIQADKLPAGYVDDRSICDVKPEELKQYTQCHFFAGIGGWSLGLQYAGWPTDRPVWTGSCPCQPFSVAGSKKAQADERHLWPVWFDLIRSCRPPVVFGEQVAAAIGHDWLDGAFDDLEREGYSCGAAVLPACAVNAPHRRDRLWFVADTANRIDPALGTRSDERRHENEISENNERRQPVERAQRMGDADRERGESGLPAPTQGCEGQTKISHDGGDRRDGAWAEYKLITGADGKTRRIEPSIPLLAHGVSSRVVKLRALGNAIVPQVAAAFITSFLDIENLEGEYK